MVYCRTTVLWTLLTMYVKMSLQLNLQTKSFITHITETRTLAITCALMCPHITHEGECFIAPNTGI